MSLNHAEKLIQMPSLNRVLEALREIIKYLKEQSTAQQIDTKLTDAAVAAFTVLADKLKDLADSVLEIANAVKNLQDRVKRVETITSNLLKAIASAAQA